MLSLEKTFNAPVIEAYGMTEAAHQMASNPLPPLHRKAGSVGVPAGPDIQIMDEAGNTIPSPGKGEIVIRGMDVMHGYLENDKANATAFTQGWFRTGDQGYFDEEGYLFITSRIKEIINRGGEKVAPREVDEVLLAHPAVLQAVTFGVSHPTLGEDVNAAVILKPGEQASENDLRRFLLERLAASKVPSRVIFVKEIPKGPTGKLQRIGLAEKLAPYLSTEFVPPQGEFEEALAAVWEELIGAHPVGALDNFFALGGDSLKALQLISRIQSALEIELPVGSIFQHPTLRDLAAVVESASMQALYADN
jgi:acyl-CoA synthetase (AMP-forming)/AMP-acid ligase II/acyl carrier protein